MQNHVVTIDNREKMMITDIAEIDSFDEEEIRANLKEGAMVIKGSKLNIKSLDLEAGTASVEGSIDSLIYVKTREKSDKGLLAKLMK